MRTGPATRSTAWVNPFDVGIVLSVAFLIGAISSLHLEGKNHGERPARDPAGEITIGRGQTVAALPRPGPRTIGRGTRARVLYRLSNGRLVYVQNAPNQENP